LELIGIQAQAALKGLDTGATEQPDGTNPEDTQEVHFNPPDHNLQRLQNFCLQILNTKDSIDKALVEVKGPAFVKRLMESLPRIPDSHTNISQHAKEQMAMPLSKNTEELKKAYVEWATQVRFQYCDLSITAPEGEPSNKNNNEKQEDTGIQNWKFCFSREARALAEADLPRRSVSIAKELAVLTTNLPVAWNSSIFLQVDETRVDIIKALIIGPEGTPYQNGCYLFDIFLGASYNQTAPSVKYMTTNGGKFRFNPNLYAEGKVCLSLLGTWNGPGWVAGKSTLLQVLVSIQSMILCDEPYLNEPGWESGAGTTQSKQYSAGVRRMVVHTAMLGNLKNPPSPFEDIIKTHFRFKKFEIAEQLDKWVTLEKSKGGNDNEDRAVHRFHSNVVSSDTFLGCVKELKELLHDL